MIQEGIINTWSSYEDLGHGIYVYRDVLPKSMNLVERLESVLREPDNIDTSEEYNGVARHIDMNDPKNRYVWKQALVGYNQIMKDYRDCVDFKYKKEEIPDDGSRESTELRNIWQECYDKQLPAVKHYSSLFNIGELRYWEAFNFIRYGKDQHFQYHHDHGFSYNCTLSLVSYLNDDYDGGELSFSLQKLDIKPRAGDTYLFPSNFMYPHAAKVVTKGVKYSLVTMLDYSSKYHDPKFYQETGD